LENDSTNNIRKAKRSTKDKKSTSMNDDPVMREVESHPVAEGTEILKDTFDPLRLSINRALPDVLPAEYLEDTEPQDILPFDQFPIKKAKKTKLYLTAEKETKDRRVGSTTYRVMKASRSNLAPKSSSQAQNVKESWLQGRSGKKLDANRTSFRKGFFKK
jgi:U3 small nucleolar RNA-associated protein 16